MTKDRDNQATNGNCVAMGRAWTANFGGELKVAKQKGCIDFTGSRVRLACKLAATGLTTMDFLLSWPSEWIRGANSSASSGLGEFACGVLRTQIALRWYLISMRLVGVYLIGVDLIGTHLMGASHRQHLIGMYHIGVYGPASQGHASHGHTIYGHAPHGYASYRRAWVS